MFKKSFNQGLIVLGLIFILAMIINFIIPLNMFTLRSQVYYIVFFVVYVAVMYIKNRNSGRKQTVLKQLCFVINQHVVFNYEIYFSQFFVVKLTLACPTRVEFCMKCACYAIARRRFFQPDNRRRKIAILPVRRENATTSQSPHFTL